MVVLYMITSPRGAAEDVPALRGARIVPVVSEDWNRDLSPWPAEGVFGEPFSGGASRFLETLRGSVIPRAEADLPEPPEERFIAGYSLAGLFSVYAAMETGLFDGFASMSGSLWFDGFAEYLETRETPGRVAKAYFSLGDREKNTKNPRMRRVEECTLRAAEGMRNRGVETVFRFHPGGHFQDVPRRIAEGIRTLLEM